VLPFRAALLGRVLHIPEPLIERRLHDASMTGGADTRERLLRLTRPTLPGLAIRLADLEHPEVARRRGTAAVAALRRAVRQSMEWHGCMLGLVEGRPGAFRALLAMVVRGRARPLAAVKALLVLRYRRLWRGYLRVSRLLRRPLDHHLAQRR
jgi:hypothetical protein